MTPSPFIPGPRRWMECWQMAEDWPGTHSQQTAVKAALEKFEFATPQHRLMQRIDRHVNAAGRSYLPIGILDMEQLELAGAGGINLSRHLQDPIIIRNYLYHGIGHVVDERDMITPEDRNAFKTAISGHDRGNWPREYRETFCDHIRDWLLAGHTAIDWPITLALLAP